MNPQTENWLATSEYDLETAEHMLKTGRYIYVVFMCHLSIEQALKAIVQEVTSAAPPRTHNLVRLMDLVKISLELPLDKFVRNLTTASVATRYPEELSKLRAQFPASVAREHFELTKEVLTCIRSDPRLKPPPPTSSIDLNSAE